MYCIRGGMAWRRDRKPSRNDTDEMPQMLKQHWMKNLLQQEGVSETRIHWKTVKRGTSHSQRQLASLKRHWSKRTGQSPDEGHEQGKIRDFLEKLGPILLWLRLTMWNPKQSTKRSMVTIGTSGTGQWRTSSRHSKTTRLGTEWDHPQTGTSYRANGSTIWNWTKWSSGQIQSTLCGAKLQTGGGTGLLWDFCAYM